MNNEEILHEKPLVVHESDHASHEHHKQSFITKYIFSQDHKMISRQFLVTGIIWALLVDYFQLFSVCNLGFPDQTFPFLEDIFGHWAKGGRLDPEFYYASGYHARNHPCIFCINCRIKRNFL